MVIKILNQELEQLKKELWNIKNKVIPEIESSSSSVTQSDLDELTEELSSISLQLSSLADDVSENASDISSIKSDISSITSSLSSLSSDLSSLNTQVGTNTSSISSMQSSISYHNSCLQSIDTRVGNLSLSIQSLSSTVSSLSSTVSSHTSSISSLTSDVSSLSTDLLSLTSDVSSLQSQTDSLEQEVQTLSSVSSGTIVTVSGNAQSTWSADTKADVSSLPTSLSQLSDDSTHRVVTDTEKATWNGKSNFDGEYSSLIGKPTYTPINASVTNITNGAVIDLSSYLPSLYNVEVLFSFAGAGKDATNSQQSAGLTSSLTSSTVYLAGGKTFTSAKGTYLAGSVFLPISSSSRQVTVVLENNRYSNELYIHGYRRI